MRADVTTLRGQLKLNAVVSTNLMMLYKRAQLILKVKNSFSTTCSRNAPKIVNNKFR